MKALRRGSVGVAVESVLRLDEDMFFDVRPSPSFCVIFSSSISADKSKRVAHAIVFQAMVDPTSTRAVAPVEISKTFMWPSARGSTGESIEIGMGPF